ncbi:hypothetical protein [Paralimibaculum aggregatum]|uniref:hypothetical protein n=1 Tax=Paralimibaculum aggregatum TaxID=3036245 RepID=UPI002556E6B1|nr:hypothetical protein [Limibaculum sp. NKW23]
MSRAGAARALDDHAFDGALRLSGAMGPGRSMARRSSPGAGLNAATLRPGSIAVFGALPAHKPAAVAEAIEAAGAHLRPLPPCNPDFTPIEPAFPMLRVGPRKQAAQARQTRGTAIATGRGRIIASEARAFLTPTGHEPECSETAQGDRAERELVAGRGEELVIASAGQSKVGPAMATGNAAQAASAGRGVALLRVVGGVEDASPGTGIGVDAAVTMPAAGCPLPVPVPVPRIGSGRCCCSAKVLPAGSRAGASPVGASSMADASLRQSLPDDWREKDRPRQSSPDRASLLAAQFGGQRRAADAIRHVSAPGRCGGDPPVVRKSRPSCRRASGHSWWQGSSLFSPSFRGAWRRGALHHRAPAQRWAATLGRRDRRG